MSFIVRILLLMSISLLGASSRSAWGQSLTTDETNWLKALVASQHTVIESLSSGSFRFASRRIKAGIEETADGQVCWDGDRLRYDVKMCRAGNESCRDESILVTKSLTVRVNKNRLKVVRSFGTRKALEECLQILPVDWLRYDFQFSLRDLITADESYQYKNRTAELIKTADEATLKLSTPSGGYVAFEFDLAADGLVLSVVNRKPDYTSYQADYEWQRVGDHWFLKKLTQQQGSKDATNMNVMFQLEISDIEINRPIAERFFSEATLGSDNTFSVTTYVNDRIQGERPGDASLAKIAKLKNLGLEAKKQGFSAPAP